LDLTSASVLATRPRPSFANATVKYVGWLERSESRDSFHAAMPIPAFASFEPGYEATK
jgi:hypothetical protein